LVYGGQAMKIYAIAIHFEDDEMHCLGYYSMESAVAATELFREGIRNETIAVVIGDGNIRCYIEEYENAGIKMKYYMMETQ
jgi:hypothetical protein